jgi:signal transduction histidine kinase
MQDEVVMKNSEHAEGQFRHHAGYLPRIPEERSYQEQRIAAMGWLAAGLAHDFNNILTAIIGHCDMLRASVPAGPIRDGLDNIRTAGERGVLLTGQLMALTRNPTGLPKLLDLRSILKDIRQILGYLVGTKINLITLVEPTVGLIKVVPGQVEQILLNLVVNARDALPLGGTITIAVDNVGDDLAAAESHADDLPGRYVRVAVADTGCGMTEQVQTGLFKPLFTTKDPDKGTGLGLFTVHQIVQQHGGYIRVSSQPRYGSRFEVYLPRFEPDSSTGRSSP